MDKLSPSSEATPPHILIVAGEASGDMHGANLVRAMHAACPEITFSGMGGDELAAAGVKVLFDASRIAVVGIVEVLSHLQDIFQARRILLEEMRTRKPSLLILIDFPDFNLLLAAQAKKLGIPVFYYISPQVWAWRSSRVHKIGRLSQRVATILPFEQKFYQQHGYTVDYVGHPLLDTVHRSQPKEDFLRKHNIPPETTCICILPGSRSKEIRTLLPDFLQAAAHFQQQHAGSCTFLLPRAPTISHAQLKAYGMEEAPPHLDIRVIDEQRYDVMAACEGAIAASGTVTLELAILEVPTVVAYRLSPKTYLIGKLLVRHVDYFCLVNLIGDSLIFPELLQEQVTPERLARELRDLLADRQPVIDNLRHLKQVLGGAGASGKAAAIALEIMHDSQ